MSLHDRMKNTRDRIFSVAMTLFNEKGFEATQVSEIAEKAGIAKGTFFNYFPTKDSLFFHIGSANIDVLSQAIRSGLESKASIADILVDQAQKIGDWADSNRMFVKQAVAARFFSSSGQAGETESRVQMRSLLMEILDRGCATGEFRRDLQVRTAALAIEGAYFAILSDWAKSDGGRTLSSLLAEGIGILLAGMRA
jgi:AcrR family transcriptional regulator